MKYPCSYIWFLFNPLYFREVHMMAECVEKNSISCEERERMKVSAHKPLVMALLKGTCSMEEKEGGPLSPIVRTTLLFYEIFIQLDIY